MIEEDGQGMNAKKREGMKEEEKGKERKKGKCKNVISSVCGSRKHFLSDLCEEMRGDEGKDKRQEGRKEEKKVRKLHQFVYAEESETLYFGST